MNRRFIVVMVGHRMTGYTDLAEAMRTAKGRSEEEEEEVRILIQEPEDPGRFNLYGKWSAGQWTSGPAK